MPGRSDFLRLFLAHQDEIHAFIYALVRDPHLSQDVLQDVALVLWEKFEEYDPARAFAAWARGIAINKVRQQREKDRRLPAPASEEVLAALARAFDATEAAAAPEQDALQACLEELPSGSRRLLELRYEMSLSLAQVSERVARTVAATQKALSRIRIALQQCVRERIGEARE
jgi:RNA polymerase sigma-70 factor (ECF subfamily)